MSKMKLPGEIANTRPDKCASQMKILLCKFSLRRFAKIVLRVLALVFLLMVTAIAILYINSTWPYNWNLPKGMPQILFNPKARDPISALQPTKPTAKTAPATVSSAIASPCGADSATADRYDVTTTKCR